MHPELGVWRSSLTIVFTMCCVRSCAPYAHCLFICALYRSQHVAHCTAPVRGRNECAAHSAMRRGFFGVGKTPRSKYLRQSESLLMPHRVTNNRARCTLRPPAHFAYLLSLIYSVYRALYKATRGLGDVVWVPRRRTRQVHERGCHNELMGARASAPPL